MMLLENHYGYPIGSFLTFVKLSVCGMGRQIAQLAITHGLQYVELKPVRVLVVYLAVSMVIQMAEGSTWLSNCEPTWCLSAALTGCCCCCFCCCFFITLGDVLHTAIQCEMPLAL